MIPSVRWLCARSSMVPDRLPVINLRKSVDVVFILFAPKACSNIRLIGDRLFCCASPADAITGRNSLFQVIDYLMIVRCRYFIRFMYLAEGVIVELPVCTLDNDFAVYKLVGNRCQRRKESGIFLGLIIK